MNLKYQINLMLKYVSKYILKAKDLKMTGIQHLKISCTFIKISTTIHI